MACRDLCATGLRNRVLVSCLTQVGSYQSECAVSRNPGPTGEQQSSRARRDFGHGLNPEIRKTLH